jgi:hypothetical protein
MGTPVIIVDIFSDVIKAVDTVLYPSIGKNIFYQYGSSIQILEKLIQLNNGITSKQTRFPLIAIFQPFDEDMGGNGYYTQLTLPKVVIATLTKKDIGVEKRYTETFKPLLYPIYYEFLNQIVQNGNFIINDPGLIPHTKSDNPGSEPPKGTEFQEFVDSIDLFNIELTVNNQLNCK